MEFNKIQFPDTWNKYSLDDVCSKITSGGTPSRTKPEFYENGIINWVKTKELNNYYIYDTEEKITEEALKKSSAKLLPTNTILLAMYGATVGELGILSKEMACNQACCALITNPKICDYRYLFYLLAFHKEEIINLATGAAQQNISAKIIRGLTFRFPDIDQQKEIADILNTLDKKIELNTQINQTLEQIAQTIFKSWFIDFDPVHAKANALASGQTAEQAIQAAMTVISGKNTQELHRLQTANPEQYQQLWEIAEAFPSGFDEEGAPRGWESKKVGEVAKIVKGKKPKLISSEPDDGFLPHILMASLSGKYTEYAQIDKSIVCDIFDTLILMDGAASGKIAIGHKGVIGSTFAKMELSENKYWALFNQFMFSKEQDIQANTTGTSIPHTDKARVLDYEIIVPCDVVLNYFTEMYKNILCSILNQRKNSFILENIRDLLLPKLLSGEV